MTDDQIDELKAGPKLDALVAEAMGWEWCPPWEIQMGGGWTRPPYSSAGAWQLSDGSYRVAFHPSTHIADAMEAADWWLAKYDNTEFGADFSLEYDGEDWTCQFGDHDRGELGWSRATTKGLAVCRAFLKAVEERESDDTSSE